MMPPFRIAVFGLRARLRTLRSQVVHDRLPRRTPNSVAIVDVVTGIFEQRRDLTPELHGDLDLVRPGARPVGATIKRLIEGVDDLALLAFVNRDADGGHAATRPASGLTLGGA